MWNLISCNKITEQRTRRKSYQRHVQNLNKMKPKLCIQQPDQPLFMYAKKKRELTRNQQLWDIEKHNHLLLSKIKMIQLRDNKKFIKPSFLTTLNSKVMIQMNAQIYKENKRICDKIMKTQAFYKTTNIIQKSNDLERVMQNISINARRVQSAKSLMSTSKRSRPISSSTKRPFSSHHLSENRSKFDTALKSFQNKLTRASSAPSIKKIKVKSTTLQKNQQLLQQPLNNQYTSQN